MSTILAARWILLVVTGPGKRDILRRMLDGEIGPALPASFLRSHPATTVLADRDAWLGDRPPDQSPG
jgi:glucosamine-6-phosphate deaminase